MTLGNKLSFCVLSSLMLAACSGALRQFPLKEPLWTDTDREPVAVEPEEYFSPFAWDGADQTIFRPIARFFAVDPGGEAVNVNALDEVPDSSWFTNRIGRQPMTPEALALGPCEAPLSAPRAPWVITGAKPNGANPGFIIKDAEGRRYLIKFDGTVQGPRATSADVIVSKLYHAAGYFVPCNQVVFFDRGILSIDPEATGENDEGEEEPLTEQHINVVFTKALRLPDGRYRASASLFLEGKPVGPFTYQNLRDDDPNDVVPHEDRRELRGARLLAAWTNHFDAREQNTLDMWIKTGAGGYIRHNILDFGDCFGSIWEPPMLGRRIGHAYYLDFGYVAADFLSFGVIERPWDTARFGPSHRVFAYYDVASFDAEGWRAGYPNPAFGRMTERDGAWMARIIAQVSDEHLRQVIRAGRYRDEFLERELFRILSGRRDKILMRYFRDLSPLSLPTLRTRAAGQTDLCLRDLAVESSMARAATRKFGVRIWQGKELQELDPIRTAYHPLGRVCTQLPSTDATPSDPVYLIVDVVASNGPVPNAPARIHLYHLGEARYRIVGLERPAGFAPPG